MISTPASVVCAPAIAYLLSVIISWDAEALDVLEKLGVLIVYASVVVVKAAGLIVIAGLCWKHIRQSWRPKQNKAEIHQKPDAQTKSGSAGV